jgi:hypothetical protein
MAITTRQTSLLVQQDWKTLYQTFREADFQSYDFETLRKSMIDYIKTYYPEDFNDFIESSEYIALIDLIAFLGQSLAFRTDLNARENFIDTAERRDSILKLARLISYNPKRNLASTGLLKISSISTTESVVDTNGLDVANLAINWNDSANDSWQEQFNAILNAAFVSSQVIGKPGNTQNINGIETEEYTVQLTPGQTPVFRFTSTVNGAQMNFEAVNATTAEQSYIYERTPSASANFNLLYRSDSLGNSSNNTGFFLYFKQGIMNTQDFSIADNLPNRVVNINFDNINNTDVWLYALDSFNREQTLWKSVPSVSGINVIYNNIAEKNLYQVGSRTNDQIDLIFGDGAFTNVPQGNFRLYYRQSNGLNYKITPDEMQNIIIPLTYTSRSGRAETLTIRASLHYTVANASAKETIDDIRTKAPQNYYTQNRMITGEDYNLFPYTQYANILKVKAVNRTSSGVSRYLDVLDVTGKYSSTNVFAQDGWLYRHEFSGSFNFQWNSTTEISKIVYNQIIPLLDAKELEHLYYKTYTRYVPNTTILWTTTQRLSTGSVGYLSEDGTTAIAVLDVGLSNKLRYVRTGSIIRFAAGIGKYFNAQNQIVTGSPTLSGDRTYIYTGVMDINDTVITLGEMVPDSAVIDQIVPQFKNNFLSALTDTVKTYIQSKKTFGLRYDDANQTWSIIESANLNTASNAYDFSLTHAGDTTGQALDTSWLIRLSYNGIDYRVDYRGINYIFESQRETRFYFDERVKVYDTKTGLTLHDQINILKINNQPDSREAIGEDQTWYVYKNIVEPDGYQSTRRILVTFPDSNSDGVPDNPDLFDNIVNPLVNPSAKYVYQQSLNDPNKFLYTQPYDNALVVSNYATQNDIKTYINIYENGQLFYATTEKVFYELSMVNSVRSLVARTDLAAYTGRQQLYFQYRHNSPNYRRIDPSPNNIMDLFILTKQYAADYAAWIQDTSGAVAEPIAPTNETLKIEFNGLENYKALSDTLIFNTARFKPLFGLRADPALQAKFKIVKNSNIVISDNDVKSTVIRAINTYFAIGQWDFGETFYFSELSAYLHTTLTPNIASIVIVPSDSAVRFGTLYQINSEANEIIISAATVDDVEIISAVTAAQINQTLALTAGVV